MESYAVSDTTVAQFQEDGAVCLRKVFNQSWLDKIEWGIAKNRQNPSQYSESLRADGGTGYYFNDYFNWNTIEEFRDYVYNSPAAGIVRKLMKSSCVAFYHEHVLSKDAGALNVTPWHQDQPYYPVDGFQNCSIWMPIDPINMENTIQFVKGSHRWDKWFYPRKFATSKNYPIEGQDFFSKRYEEIPITEIDEGRYDILQWELEPGDCIVFHMLTLHAAHGNASPRPRRVLSTRWLGDDAVLGQRPWEVSPPIVPEGLQPGQSLASCELFPVIRKVGQ